MTTNPNLPAFVNIAVVLFVINLSSNISYGQPKRLTFQHLNIENGLSDNSINCVAQDDAGFIWLGGDFGLSKFNGYTSSLIPVYPKDSFENHTARISTSFNDSKGRLWIGSVGLIMFDPITNQCKIFQHERNNINSVPHNDVFAIVEDECHTIWVGTRKGLLKFNELTKDFTIFVHDTIGTTAEVHAKNRIIDLVADQQGFLWMTTLSGMYRFSISENTFEGYMLDTAHPNSEIENHSTFLCLDKKGAIWINYYSKGIFLFDTIRKRYNRIVFPNSEMDHAAKRTNDLFCDSKGNIWIASSFNGILFYSQQTKTWDHFKHDPFDQTSLSDNKTSSIFEDQSGMIWIGTSSRGIDRVNLTGDKFDVYLLQPGKKFSLCENDITSFCEDRAGNLWIGSKNGLMYFNTASNKFSCFKYDLHNKNSISDNCIYAVAIDTSEILWVATENGLNSYDSKSKVWKRYLYKYGDSTSLPGRVAFDVIVRRNGEVWVATNGLVCRLISKQGSFENRYNNPVIEKMRHSFYTTVFEDSRKTVWLSTARAGILNVDDSFNTLYSYYHTADFKATTVHQFAEDSLGNIWMASDKGVYVWNRANARILKLKSTEDILNGDIRSIVVDNNSSLWLSTYQGLFQVHILPNYTIASFRKFSSSDGLQSNAFNTFAGLKLKSGALCFGGINGFNIFDPDKIVSNQYIPFVHIESFKIGTQAYETFYQNGAKALSLNYHQHSFSFEMTALNFNHPEKNEYSYQLEGFHQNMIYNGTYRIASINNVPPGDYVLHVIASNNDGIWNHQGIRVPITIWPPFWQTIWFRILVCFVLMGLAYLLYKKRIHAIKKMEQFNAETVRQIAEARLSALRAQMNPHFIFNSLNSIQHLITESEKDKALRYLSKFSKLIRLILKNASKNTNTIAEELKILEYYLDLEALRFSPRFSYHFDIDSKLNIDMIEIPSMLLQPFVENALVHGLLHKETAGFLEISMRKSGAHLHCSITDNGIGREAALIIQQQKGLHHDSLALQLSTERIAMLAKISNKQLSIDIQDLKDEQGAILGTKVYIEIPLDLA